MRGIPRPLLFPIQPGKPSRVPRNATVTTFSTSNCGVYIRTFLRGQDRCSNVQHYREISSFKDSMEMAFLFDYEMSCNPWLRSGNIPSEFQTNRNGPNTTVRDRAARIVIGNHCRSPSKYQSLKVKSAQIGRTIHMKNNAPSNTTLTFILVQAPLSRPGSQGNNSHLDTRKVHVRTAHAL